MTLSQWSDTWEILGTFISGDLAFYGLTESEITQFVLIHLSAILFYLIPFKAIQIVSKLYIQIFFRREFE